MPGIQPEDARPVRLDRRKEVAAVRHGQAVQRARADYVLRPAAGRPLPALAWSAHDNYRAGQPPEFVGTRRSVPRRGRGVSGCRNSHLEKARSLYSLLFAGNYQRTMPFCIEISKALAP